MSSLVNLLPDIAAHRSGALYIPSSRTILVADAHLGYSFAQRRRGELGPLADEQTREKLLQLFDELKPRRAVFVGDLVHAPGPSEEERAWVAQVIWELSEQAALTSLRGNHDRAFARDFADLPIEAEESWDDGNVFAMHGDRLPASRRTDRVLVVGHLHPSLPVRDAAGAARKLPMFLVNRRCIVMPAFSPFAGGYDLLGGLPSELCSCFAGEEIQTYAVSPTRVAALGLLHRAVERMFEADRGAPERFRKPSRKATTHTSKSGR